MAVKKILTLLVSVGLLISVNAQSKKKPVTKKPAPKQAASANRTPKTLLWEVSGNGLRESSYLFGTMHILCAEDAQLSPGLERIIKTANKIYFEIDMDDMAEMMGGLKYLRMNDGVKISDLLTPEEYRKLEDYFKSRKTPMPMSMLNRFKPYFVSALLSDQTMDCAKKDGMEQVIMTKAKENEKTIHGLETLQFQASVFDSIPYAKQAKDLIQYIDSIDSYSKVTRSMAAVYKSQDIEAMDSLMVKSDPSMKAYMDLLLYGRNRKWVHQMANIMNEGLILFAVGAGHLGGEQGVINLLRKRGYTVKPLPNVWPAAKPVSKTN